MTGSGVDQDPGRSSRLEDFVPELPRGNDGVQPECQHHDHDDDLFGRNFTQVSGIRNQGPVQADHRALCRDPRVMFGVVQSVVQER